MVPMSSVSSLDTVNRSTMRASARFYASLSGLEVSEKKALDDIMHNVKGKRILDVGVGGARTTAALLEMSSQYVGVDYIEGMISHCRQRFPHVCFEVADARDMPQFKNSSFDLIVFAWSGISMVDHTGRMSILKEMYRLLAPGGYFVFSTYNLGARERAQRFTFPDFTFPKNPARLAKQAVGFCKHTVLSIINRLRYKKQEVYTSEYAIINDKCHDYRTMLYYISLAHQRAQLRAVGFESNASIYSADGNRVVQDDSLTGDTFLVVVQR